jgi:hypothetical protein
MIGELVPVTLLPRFTSFVGAGTYATPPLQVEAFDLASLTFGRGPRVGGAAQDPFRTWLEGSHDAQAWTTLAGPISSASTVTSVGTPLSCRWLRVKVQLQGDAGGLVGITLWMSGGLRRRVP